MVLSILSPVDTSLTCQGQFVGISQRGHLRERGERKKPKQSGDFPPAPVTVSLKFIPNSFEMNLHSLSLHPHPSFPRFTSWFSDIVCDLEGSLITLVALNVPFCLGREFVRRPCLWGIESLFVALVCGGFSVSFCRFLRDRTTDNY